MATNDFLNTPLAGSTGSGQYVGSVGAPIITPELGVASGTSIQLNGTTVINGAIDDDTFATASASTIATSESIKAFIDTESIPAGKVVQFVLAGSNMNDSTNSTTPVDTSLTATINPFSATNNILVFASSFGFVTNSGGVVEIRRTSNYRIMRTSGTPASIFGPIIMGVNLTAANTAPAQSRNGFLLMGSEVAGDTTPHTYMFQFASTMASLTSTLFNNSTAGGFMLILELKA